jgi:hypothetical protein
MAARIYKDRRGIRQTQPVATIYAFIASIKAVNTGYGKQANNLLDWLDMPDDKVAFLQ